MKYANETMVKNQLLLLEILQNIKSLLVCENSLLFSILWWWLITTGPRQAEYDTQVNINVYKTLLDVKYYEQGKSATLWHYVWQTLTQNMYFQYSKKVISNNNYR